MAQAKENNQEGMVYLIRIFHMLNNIKFHTFEPCPELEVRLHGSHQRFFDKDTNTERVGGNTHYYSTSIPKGAISAEEKFLPYRANVIEDLPGWAKFTSKTYDNCQLMTEKHGGYMQFWHEPSKQVLRIALNSHIYQPLP